MALPVSVAQHASPGFHVQMKVALTHSRVQHQWPRAPTAPHRLMRSLVKNHNSCQDTRSALSGIGYYWRVARTCRKNVQLLRPAKRTTALHDPAHTGDRADPLLLAKSHQYSWQPFLAAAEPSAGGVLRISDFDRKPVEGLSVFVFKRLVRHTLLYTPPPSGGVLRSHIDIYSG